MHADQSIPRGGWPGSGDRIQSALYAYYQQYYIVGFRDIVPGDNGVYSAGPHYDAVTGLGVPVFFGMPPAFAPPVPVPYVYFDDLRLLDVEAGQDFSYQITASPTPISYAVDGLPDGLSLDQATSLITGVPTTPGSYYLTVSATNQSGTGTAATFLEVYSPPVPEVVLHTTVAKAVYEAGQLGVFSVDVFDPPAAGLTVYYTLSGNATNGRDYNHLRGSIKFPAEQTHREILIFPRGNLTGGGKRNVVLTLAPDDSYTLNIFDHGRVTISNQ